MSKPSQRPWGVRPSEKDCRCAAAILVTLVVVLSISHCWPTLFVAAEAEMPCDEVYIVGEGETLQSIMDKCGDPFIVQNNPLIHDSDELFPGLVIKVVPLSVTDDDDIIDM
ncbi:hypothetical protein CASFOL_009403 [Castilleja foliolosa]|uniref:LysM domain-containing protein n=1 Tax=Castilleja foliolosa TaxID=1961234 RepID=A0ABD3DYA4_9LAMI